MRVRPGVWAIVVAGGTGARFGGPKQFSELAGRRVVDHSIAAARSVAGGVVLVVPDVGAGPECGADRVVPGAPTRSGSVRSGLAVVPASAGIIVVHDAVRPLAGPDLFEAVVAAVEAGADGAVPGVPVPDTVRRVGADGRPLATLDRSDLVLIQTPQAFSASALRAAHSRLGEATDDAALIESAGGSVVVVPGDPRNLKITHPHDLVVAEALLRARQ